MTSKEKTTFRQTVAWKRFREELLRTRGLKCQLSGVKLTLKTAQVHHIFPDEYDNLDPARFAVLSPSMHDFVESIAPIVWGNRTSVPNQESLLAWCGWCLPRVSRSVDKLYKDMLYTLPDRG